MPYLLGELAEGERERIETLLAEEPALRREYDQLEATGAHLAQSLPEVVAPAALRSRVLDAVAAAAEPHAFTPAATPVADLRARRAVRRFRLPPLATGFAAGCAAASILFAGLVLGVGLGVDDESGTPSKPATDDVSIPSDMGQATFRPVSTSGALRSAKGVLVGLGDNDQVLVVRNLPSPGAGGPGRCGPRTSAATCETSARGSAPRRRSC